MIAWHVGAILFLFRWIFQDPKVDVRFLVVGALLPDLIDIPLGTIMLAGALGSSEVFAHTLLVPTLVAIVILFATRRGRRRRAWMALIVAWFLHLLIDGMWTSTEVFLWPFFGVDFPAGPEQFWGGLIDRSLSDPWRWATEAIGLGYLLWLWLATGLNLPGRRRQVLETGRLPGYVGAENSE